MASAVDCYDTTLNAADETGDFLSRACVSNSGFPRERPCLNLSPDVLLGPAEPCSVWLGRGGMTVKIVYVCRCWAWQFLPNRLWRCHLYSLTSAARWLWINCCMGQDFILCQDDFQMLDLKLHCPLPFSFLMLCSLVVQAKRCNAELSSMPSCVHVARQTDEIAWEHREHCNG